MRRNKQVDVLKKIRAAMRSLRAAEASILFVERSEKRRLIKAADRAELERMARALPARNELERESGRRAAFLERGLEDPTKPINPGDAYFERSPNGPGSR